MCLSFHLCGLRLWFAASVPEVNDVNDGIGVIDTVDHLVEFGDNHTAIGRRTIGEKWFYRSEMRVGCEIQTRLLYFIEEQVSIFLAKLTLDVSGCFTNFLPRKFVINTLILYPCHFRCFFVSGLFFQFVHHFVEFIHAPLSDVTF